MHLVWLQWTWTWVIYSWSLPHAEPVNLLLYKISHLLCSPLCFFKGVSCLLISCAEQLNMAAVKCKISFFFTSCLHDLGDTQKRWLYVYASDIIWEGKLHNSLFLLAQIHLTSKPPVLEQTLDARSQRDPRWQGTFSPHSGLEILCVDDWLGPTCIEIQTGGCVSLRFNKTPHKVPH